MERIKTHWKSKPFKGWRIVGLLLIAGLLIARYSIWVMVENANNQTASGRFSTVIKNNVAQLHNQFEVYADTLYSARALLLTNKSVSRHDWTNFVDAQNIEQRFPSVYGIAYVRLISSSQAASLTNQLNANRLPAEKTLITIYPASTQNQMAVLTYLAPESANQQVIGYDLLTSSARKQELNSARDTGLPQASIPLKLVSDPKNSPPSLLIAMPVYEPGPLSTVVERQSALTGYVVLSIHTQPLLDSIFKGPMIYGPMALTVSANNQTIYHTGIQSSSRQLQKTVIVDVAGQPWKLDFSAPSNFGLNRTARLAPNVLLWSIVSFALILFLAFYFAINFQVLRHRQHDTVKDLEDKDD